MEGNARKPAERPAQGETSVIAVWDPLLRLFHWLLVAAVAIAVVTGEIGGSAMVWHGRAGVVVAGLLAFRLVWGIIGPETARFAAFVRGPNAIVSYLRGAWHGIGHNPLGALSVVAMLGILTLQVTLGLFAYDEIAFRGPLAQLLDEAWQLRFTSWHRQLAPLLIALVVLHVAAILFYRLVKKEDLVRPMVTGYRSMPTAEKEISGVSWSGARYWLRGAVAVVFGVAAAWGASGVWLPAPAPTAYEVPAW